MATLRPPSTSPSPSPAPPGPDNRHRASMGPAARVSAAAASTTSSILPPSPRPGGTAGVRPTSELLGTAGMFQTPEAEAIDQWFKNLQNYEATLEEMAAASLDVNFKEELSAIEQWFKVLSEAERTAALYSLLQHSTQVQIRFFITVLQQMARSDPMTALLSPAVGGSMQTQMEAKLVSMNLKSPGLKSTMPSSPTMRNFSGTGVPNPNRQSVAVDTTSTASNFLSPDSAAVNAGANAGGSTTSDAAATLAQQRAKLKASNAAHRISAPVLSPSHGDRPNAWNPIPSQLGQVAEQGAGGQGQDIVVTGSTRPQSTEFSGSLGMGPPTSPRPHPEATGTGTTAAAALSPMVGDSWASMVNTPLIPMFQKDTGAGAAGGVNRNPLDAPAAKLPDWAPGAVPRMGDPKIYRRQAKVATSASGAGDSGAVYDNDGNLMQHHHQYQQMRRNLNGPGGPFGGGGGANNNNNNPGWNGARSPALAGGNGRFGEGAGGADGLGVPNGFGLGMGMPSPGLLPGVPGMAGLGAMGMGQLSPFMMNMAAMGMTPEAQLLAAQMAGFAPNNWMNMASGLSAGMGGMGGGSAGIGGGNRSSSRGPGSARSAGGKSSAGTSAGGKKDEEDFDPQILNDVPGWLRSLRLHKYTPNFEGMKWQDMVLLDEAALERMGVAALGARRKMLKTFEIVKKKMGMATTETPMPSAAATSATTASSGHNSAAVTTTTNNATAVEASA